MSHLLALHVHTSGMRGDEVRAAAAGLGVVQLGHGCVRLLFIIIDRGQKAKLCTVKCRNFSDRLRDDFWDSQP